MRSRGGGGEEEGRGDEEEERGEEGGGVGCLNFMYKTWCMVLGQSENGCV